MNNDILDAPTHACRHCGIPVVLSALLHGVECRTCFDRENETFPVGCTVSLKPTAKGYEDRDGTHGEVLHLWRGRPEPDSRPIEVYWRRHRSYHWHDELIREGWPRLKRYAFK